MKLDELLYCLSPETFVGIFDIRCPVKQNPGKYEKWPVRQHYCKVRNLQYYEIVNLLRLDVFAVNVVQGGLLIRVCDKENTKTEIQFSSLARKIREGR